jgi:hypothetical protein
VSHPAGCQRVHTSAATLRSQPPKSGVFFFEIPDLLEADHLGKVVEGVERRFHRLVVHMRVIDARQCFGCREQTSRRETSSAM